MEADTWKVALQALNVEDLPTLFTPDAIHRLENIPFHSIQQEQVMPPSVTCKLL